MQGDTHREWVKDECVCGRCTALSPSLSRGHHRSRSRTHNKKKKQKRGGGVGNRGAAVTVARRHRSVWLSGDRFHCFWCWFIGFSTDVDITICGVVEGSFGIVPFRIVTILIRHSPEITIATCRDG
ncbi:hypothetical protein TcCL_NonESM12547 [Trypanosoma cruzi]|nr:hypothetical protein TcCL_NonESM12547 [Trypanosoma cruzi]